MGVAHAGTFPREPGAVGADDQGPGERGRGEGSAAPCLGWGDRAEQPRYSRPARPRQPPGGFRDRGGLLTAAGLTRTRADARWKPAELSWLGRERSAKDAPRSRGAGQGGAGGLACVLIGWRLRARADQRTPRPPRRAARRFHVPSPQLSPRRRGAAHVDAVCTGTAWPWERPRASPLAACFGFHFPGKGFSPLLLLRPATKASGMPCLVNSPEEIGRQLFRRTLGWEALNKSSERRD